VSWGLSQALGTIISLVLVLVMITATLLTMADRKWSALMQDRVGPNRARLPIPGLRDMPLKGIPHILADVLKMLFKEDFIPEGAFGNRLLFNLAPLLAFAPRPRSMLFPHRAGEPRAELLGRAPAAAGRPGRLGHPLRLRAGIDRGVRHGPRRVGLEQQVSRCWAACALLRSWSATR